MSSLKSPEPVFGLGGEDAIRSAICDVGERSFFAIVDPCDDARFAELASAHRAWLVATVRFHEEACEGAMSCALPAPLAIRLYDAFTGRDPGQPPPEPDQLFDLVGEFANMICGGWLTRAATHQTFSLGRPVVASWPDGWIRPDIGRGITFAIDEFPLLIDADVPAEGRPGQPASTSSETGAAW